MSAKFLVNFVTEISVVIKDVFCRGKSTTLSNSTI